MGGNNIMVAFTTMPSEKKCFKCGNKRGIFLMSDTELTKGTMVNLCKGCYWKEFDEKVTKKCPILTVCEVCEELIGKCETIHMLEVHGMPKGWGSCERHTKK